MASSRISKLAISWILLVPFYVLVFGLHAQTNTEQSPAQEQLEAAVFHLDARRAREALRVGADPNYRFRGRGKSVLDMTGMGVFPISSGERINRQTEERWLETLDVLFNAGARLGAHDREILHGPAIAGAPKVVKYLLKRGADPNGTSSADTPVLLATQYGHPDVVAALVAGGAKPLEPATQAQIRMIDAAGRGDLLTLRRELSRGAELNRKGPTGKTALVEAIVNGPIRGGTPLIVGEMLKLGANPSMTASFIGQNEIMRFIGDCSPLHAAVFNIRMISGPGNGSAVVDALLEAGADVSSVAFDRKQTPLHLAVRMQNTEAATLLLKAGANVMLRDEDGTTPLDLASSPAMIELLKAQGAREQ